MWISIDDLGYLISFMYKKRRLFTLRLPLPLKWGSIKYLFKKDRL